MRAGNRKNQSKENRQSLRGRYIKASAKYELPPLVFVAFSGTLAAGYIETNLLYFNISGLAWAGTLLVALSLLIFRAPKWKFPIYIWLPWLLLLFLYLPFSLLNNYDLKVSPVQRSFQLITPVVVALTLSTYPVRLYMLKKFVNWFRVFLVILWILAVVTNIDAILAFKTTGLAGQAMTGMVGCAFFVCRYFLYRHYRDLVMYLFMATMPIFAVTRTVIAVTLLIPVIMFVPISILYRLILIGLALLAGMLVFFLPQVQRKMFYSGSGNLDEVRLDNEEMATSGRAYIWDKLLSYANQSPWFGHGTGQGETFTYSITPVGYPHNDWLLTYTDYGAFGVSVFLLCNLWMMLDCWRHGRKVRHPTVKLFFYAGASSFIPFMLVMFTDNIMVYASFFGILQYTIIGLAYGALNTLKKRPKRERKRVASSQTTPVLRTAKVDLPSPG